MDLESKTEMELFVLNEKLTKSQEDMDLKYAILAQLCRVQNETRREPIYISSSWYGQPNGLTQL